MSKKSFLKIEFVNKNEKVGSKHNAVNSDFL